MHWVVQLMLEEFGKWVKNSTAADEAQRDAFYTLVYDALQMVSRRPDASSMVLCTFALKSQGRRGGVGWHGARWGMVGWGVVGWGVVGWGGIAASSVDCQ